MPPHGASQGSEQDVVDGGAAEALADDLEICDRRTLHGAPSDHLGVLDVDVRGGLECRGLVIAHEDELPHGREPVPQHLATIGSLPAVRPAVGHALWRLVRRRGLHEDPHQRAAVGHGVVDPEQRRGAGPAVLVREVLVVPHLPGRPLEVELLRLELGNGHLEPLLVDWLLHCAEVMRDLHLGVRPVRPQAPSHNESLPEAGEDRLAGRQVVLLKLAEDCLSLHWLFRDEEAMDDGVGHEVRPGRGDSVEVLPARVEEAVEQRREEEGP
mmetsp:Transcript_35451/g.89287  ORF Transcript_35451/g.89287 Transcript_35451/m.89287 type:complete len:269 (-) Transcript_35451:271-1077(-)